MSARLPFLLSLLVFAISISQAQSTLGLELGASQNALLTNTQNEPQLKYNTRGGFAMAIPLTYTLGKGFSLHLQPAWIEKNYSITNSTNSALYEKFTNNYLLLAATAGYSRTYKKWSATLEAGGFAAYWLSGQIHSNVRREIGTTTYNTFTSSYLFNPTRDQRRELGWQLGGLVERKLSQKLSLALHYTFYQALTDQQKNYLQGLVPRYNRSQTVLLGARYVFKNNKKKS